MDTDVNVEVEEPKITKFKKIPAMQTLPIGGSLATLPGKVSHALTYENLIELYGFEEIDSDPDWAYSSYTQEQDNETYKDSVDICDREENDPDSPEPYNTWYTAVKRQQNLIDGREQRWIRESDLSAEIEDAPVTWALTSGAVTSGFGFLNIGEAIHPQATPNKPITPPMPTPTFVPKVANVRIDKSLKAFMNAKSGTLAVTPPEEECEEGAKPVLVYNAETAMAEWECQETSDSSCCCVAVYNNSDEIIYKRAPVIFDLSTYMVDWAALVKPYDGESDLWGVLNETLAPGTFGTATISGPVEVYGTPNSSKDIWAVPQGTYFTFTEKEEKGRARVIARSKYTSDGEQNRTIILLGGTNGHMPVAGYSGYFSTRDTGTPEEGLKVLVSGGNTDLGTVHGREFKIEDSVHIYLLAEYIRTGEKTGRYQLKLTDDYEKERVSDEFALWDIAVVSIEEDVTGKKKLKITQQWQNGEIYWGSRYWI